MRPNRASAPLLAMALALAASPALADTPPAVTDPAAAAAPDAPDSGPALGDLPDWQQRLYKTASYQTLSALNDFAIVAALSGSAATGGILAATTALTEPVLYYAHETVWSGVAVETGQSNAELLPYKSATFTSVNMGRVFVAGLLVMNNPTLAASYVALTAVGDAMSYAANETVWNYLTMEEEPAFAITSLLPFDPAPSESSSLAPPDPASTHPSPDTVID